MDRIYERNQFAVLAPQSITGAAVTSSYVSMAKARRFCAVVITETIAAGESVQADILEAKDAAGTGAQAIAGATVTLNDTIQGPAIVEVHTDNMTDGYSHLAIRATVTGTVLVGAVAVISDLAKRPATQPGVVAAPKIQ